MFLPLAERYSGYAGTTKDWQEFLSCWSETSRTVQASVLSKSRLARQGLRSPEQIRDAIVQAEERLGIRFPTSYRDFVLTYDPPRYAPQTTANGIALQVGMFAPEDVERYSKFAPRMLKEEEKYPIHAEDHQYYVYGMKQNDVAVRTSHHREALVVGKYGDSRYEVIVLYPMERTSDGEMEAALFEHSGEFRASSFAELMRQLSFLETGAVESMPPYSQVVLKKTCASKLPLLGTWWE